MSKYVVDFDAFSSPMQDMLREAEEADSSYVVCSANPRQIDGKPTKNPRYLQIRPDLVKPFHSYVTRMATRLVRAVPADQPVLNPVNAVMVGRRNNPPDREKGIRSLAVYSPIHYQELPELFMDFICSLTGKSPSTTGAGSEGALTKGPFNALRPAADLNSSLVGFILTGYAGFSTAAGHIGPNVRVDHDVSLLIPEIWCRMQPEERDPQYLIKEELLEPITDFEHNGQPIPASRLGYRITSKFLNRFFGRVFDNPASVFDETILQPEKQDLDSFVDGIQYIAEAQQRVALQYFEDGSFEEACPPLQAILSIMAHGSWEGHSIHDSEVRSLFTQEALLKSDWYQERLVARQDQEVALLQRQLIYLDKFVQHPGYMRESKRLNIVERREWVEHRLLQVSSSEYLNELVGTIGAQPRKDLNQRAE
jgi:phosphoenolpyruvate carboxykinase (diphosphate)